MKTSLVEEKITVGIPQEWNRYKFQFSDDFFVDYLANVHGFVWNRLLR